LCSLLSGASLDIFALSKFPKVDLALHILL